MPSADKRSIAGYTVADYLPQRLTRQRRTARIPDPTWRALADHISDPKDQNRLARSAETRQLHDLARQVFRRAADADDWPAAVQLARLGDHEALRARAATGDDQAAFLLAKAVHGDTDELFARANAGDREAAAKLAKFLARRGDLDTLRACAIAGNHSATAELAKLFAERDDLDEHSRIDELRARADAGDREAAQSLDKLLERVGSQQTKDLLRARADTGNREAVRLLAAVLAERGDLDELRALADTGDHWLAANGCGMWSEIVN